MGDERLSQWPHNCREGIKKWLTYCLTFLLQACPLLLNFPSFQNQSIYKTNQCLLYPLQEQRLDNAIIGRASCQVQVSPVPWVQCQALPRAWWQGGLEHELAAVWSSQLHRPISVEETSMGRSGYWVSSMYLCLIMLLNTVSTCQPVSGSVLIAVLVTFAYFAALSLQSLTLWMVLWTEPALRASTKSKRESHCKLFSTTVVVF